MGTGLTVRDDPGRSRGLQSRPFDGGGVPGVPRALVDGGVLTTWVLDWRSARQLGRASMGHAARGTSGPPHPAATSLWLEPGDLSSAEMIADIAEGFYVTELTGMGVNGITDGYSRGAAGFAIRGDVLAEPVSGVTVVGNLRDMFRSMPPARDLRFQRSTDSPTVRVEGLTVAGG